MLTAVAHDVVIIIIEYQRDRLHDIVMAVPAIYSSAILINVEVSEDDLLIMLYSGLYGIDIIVDSFVAMLSSIEVNNVVL